ncbi:YwmB family TATA-box binding protein [Bacillus horti]|uniref:Uncharacterized protein n=1 Tax=Caldalkalibacillus horti TaxID=77523 RepID=A0ABT9VZN0_9BACI|nr:YwmB family TATA-box binding protein [Bacillus horti]MDQ0166437.1 hypothetical protein [Bacillus horti]
MTLSGKRLKASWVKRGLSGLCLIFLAHTGLQVHSMTIDQAFPSIGEITQELYSVAEQEGLEQLKWSVVWRGQIPYEQQENALAWINSSPRPFGEKDTSEADLMKNNFASDHPILQESWTKEEQDTVLQLQLYSYPHKGHSITNFILVWSGDKSINMWDTYVPHIEELEERISEQFTPEYEVFTTIEGVADPMLLHLDQAQDTFTNWIMDAYNGNLSHVVSDTNFLSVTGYIPAWGNQILSVGQDITNVQLSARYNAIAEQTRVTLGYPLILTEH